MDTSPTKEEITYKPSSLQKIVRFTIFCFSFYIGDHIVRSGEGKIPCFIMFVLPAITLLPLIETLICKITLSTTGIKVRTFFRNWAIDWNQITSWKIISNTGQTVGSARVGTHFIFHVGNKSYSLMELHKYSALKHFDEIKDWIKIHVKSKAQNG
jgi:hypothetical protein